MFVFQQLSVSSNDLGLRAIEISLANRVEHRLLVVFRADDASKPLRVELIDKVHSEMAIRPLVLMQNDNIDRLRKLIQLEQQLLFVFIFRVFDVFASYPFKKMDVALDAICFRSDNLGLIVGNKVVVGDRYWLIVGQAKNER